MSKPSSERTVPELNGDSFVDRQSASGESSSTSITATTGNKDSNSRHFNHIHHNHHNHHHHGFGLNEHEDGSPASHFFTTVISAAQNAASSLAGMKGSGTAGTGTASNSSGPNSGDLDSPAVNALLSHNRSLSDNSMYREFDEKHENEPHNVNDVMFAPLKSAISTLGKGELSLQSLGIPDEVDVKETQQQQPQEQQQESSSLSPHHQPQLAPDETESIASNVSNETTTETSPRKVSHAQNEFSQGGTLAIPVMSRSKSRASSLISKHRRHRKRTHSTNTTIDSSASTQETDSPPSDESTPGNHLTGFAYANKKRNKDFHRLFRSVTSDDFLLDDFSCALSKEILIQGRLYVSERHVCFNSNILGWVTNLVIAFDEIVSLEKRNTAGLFPNGIIIQTLHARHSFASFVSRDSALEFLTGIWKQASPHQAREGVINGSADSDSDGYDDDDDDDDDDEEDDDDDDDGYDRDVEDRSVGSNGFSDDDEFNYPESEGETLGTFGSSSDDDFDSGVNEAVQTEDTTAPVKSAGSEENGEKGGDVNEGKSNKASSDKWPVANLGPETHGPTETGLDPGSSGEKILSSDSFAAPLGVISNLVFGDDTSWMKRFIIENQRNENLKELPSFKPDSEGKKVRNYEYIKPLNAPVGPKQTKCVCTDTIESWDLEQKVVVVTSTATPDVPSGGSFLTKTRYALSWGDNNQTKLVLSYWMEWSGKSWIKGAIERGSHDGQMNFASELTKEINKTLSAKKSARSKAGDSAGGAKKKAKGTKKGRRSGAKAKAARAAAAPDGAAAMPSAAQTGQASAIIKTMNSVPLSPIPLPIWGWVILALVFYTFVSPILFSTRSSSSGAGAGRRTLSRLESDKLDRMVIEEEFDLWKWIDDRSSSGERSQYNSKMDVGSRYGRQELEESIRITEHRLKILKQNLDV